MERETEIGILEEQYNSRVLSIAEEVNRIQELLTTWSNSERAAYEDRINHLAADEANKLMLSERSIKELKELYGACERLSLANPLPLYKAIYELYLRGAVKELVGRVVGGSKCGIYKIWNVESGKVYVGQSVDIAERWKQHIKRGVKCEVGTIAGGSLYEAM